MSGLADPVAAQPVAAGADRYPGVQPFGDTALDRLRFFGRADEARLLFHQLLSSELLVLFAKPGLGKTSLLNVRICALLRERDFLPLRVRFNHTDASLTPIEVIGAAIVQACKTEQIDYTPGTGESLWEFFKTAVFWRGERLQTPVLVLDQFEEIFMLQGENFRHDAAAELGELTARRVPERIIRRLQKEQTLPFSDKPPEVKVLISMREDNLGMLQELTPQIPAILQNRFRLTGLSADDARRAIVKPAALVSEQIQFATRPFAYKEEAIEEMIAAARTKEGIEPFVLQILCSHVEKQRQQRQASELPADSLFEVDSDYLGGEQGIKTVAAGFYIDAVNGISDSQVRERARELCEEGLLTASGGRRSLLKEDIEANFEVDSRSLDVLENVRLLHKESKHGSFYYEISHDRLASAIYEKRVSRELKVEAKKRKEAERVMDYLISDLRGRLQPLGRLDLLKEVQKQVDAYYGVDYRDVQGLVRFGYGKLKGARYALAKIKNLEAARSWLLSAPITSAVEMKPAPSTALQVAFTAEGLTALRVPNSVIESFSHEFVSGMTEESRSRRLGDVGDNAPSKWRWGGPGKVPHLVVMFFAKSELLEGFVQGSTSGVWNEAFDVETWLYTSDLDGIEPFGFADGISQPQIDWSQRRDMLAPQIDYGNIVALGEFLLGYRNEYGKYTDRPLVDADAASAGLLPEEAFITPFFLKRLLASFSSSKKVFGKNYTDRPLVYDDAANAELLPEKALEKRDVGRNGTYLVMRQLHQDVRGFWQFLSERAGGDPAEAEKLAAAMVGRTKAGDPLVPIQQDPIPGIGPDPDEIRRNQFTYDGDPAGVLCPFGAHVRRTNPRNTDFPGRSEGLLSKLVTMLGFGPKGFRDDLMSSVRYHRILRRGREYGSVGLSAAKALAPKEPDDQEYGLHFICLNTNILRQFEFLQNAWIASSKFSGMTGESDPLLGNRKAIPGCPVTSDFNMPQDGGLRRRVSGLPRFVTVRGGAYFFLPSIRVLRYFAKVSLSR
ncbi:MAG TPA: hypothetical protein VIS96_13400 [Terrimicrobiaceae bacterium]